MHLDQTYAQRAPGQRRLVGYFTAVAADLGMSVSPNAMVLDFGCGDGGAVDAWQEAGYDAYGCDVGLERQDGRLRLIETPYRLPFENEAFDLVVSNMVLEHVQDYEASFKEICRVLKPSGLSLHLFPGRWTPVEPHLRVPLGTVIQSYRWLALWARLGIRNEFQTNVGWRDVAAFNAKYLRTRTSYPPGKRLLAIAQQWFDRAEFVDTLSIKHGERTRSIYPLAHALPPVSRLYGTVRTRLLLLARA